FPEGSHARTGALLKRLVGPTSRRPPRRPGVPARRGARRSETINGREGRSSALENEAVGDPADAPWAPMSVPGAVKRDTPALATAAQARAPAAVQTLRAFGPRPKDGRGRRRLRGGVVAGRERHHSDGRRRRHSQERAGLRAPSTGSRLGTLAAAGPMRD